MYRMATAVPYRLRRPNRDRPDSYRLCLSDHTTDARHLPIPTLILESWMDPKSKSHWLHLAVLEETWPHDTLSFEFQFPFIKRAFHYTTPNQSVFEIPAKPKIMLQNDLQNKEHFGTVELQ